MKRLFIALWIFLPFGLYAQTKVNCEKYQNENLALKAKVTALQQDTLFLRSKLAYYDKLNSNIDYSISSFSSQFNIKVLSCTGDRGAQTVRVEFVMHHKKANQKFQIGGYNKTLNAYDEIGNTFNVKAVGIGTENSYNEVKAVVPTDIDVRCFVTFSGIIGGTDKFKLVQFYVRTSNADGGQNDMEGNIDIRNIKINWL